MNQPTVNRADWPAEKDWPKPGWKHALNADRFVRGQVFGWHEDGRLWTGIIEDIKACSVLVRDVMPGVLKT
jgi:hypothetical protein